MLYTKIDLIKSGGFNLLCSEYLTKITDVYKQIVWCYYHNS